MTLVHELAAKSKASNEILCSDLIFMTIKI